MSTPPATTDLVRWEVPFAEARDPSVSIITGDDGDMVLLVVAPHGIDKYPKYLVRFTNVVTLLCYDEICAFDRGYGFDATHPAKYCAYRWVASPWLRNSRVLEDIAFNKSQEKLQHYVILGGDSIVEVIALGEGKVERVEAKMVVQIEHKV